MENSIVIVGGARTAIGSLLGAFQNASAADLGGAAIVGALEDAKVPPHDVDELIMGCVLPAGQGQAPARQAGFRAGLGNAVPACTVNKMCGSGMKAVMTAFEQIKSGAGGIVVAGGMESMTNAPHLLPKMRRGARLGHGKIVDHMFVDGLEDAYEPGRLMGSFAEDCAERYKFSRES